MNWKFRKIHIAALLFGILAILWLLRTCGAKHELQWLDKDGKPLRGSDAESRAHARAGDLALIGFLNAFERRIDLYGKVVDQHGDPIEGATVLLMPVDDPMGEGSKTKVSVISDGEGKFSVRGMHGFSMGVLASKAGYRHYSPLGGPASSAQVSYANNAKDGKKYSNPKTPLILTLGKPSAEHGSIVHVERKRWKMPVDGQVRKIALDSKEGKGPHQIEFRYQTDWFKLPRTNESYGKRFDWSFEMRIPGGGFVEDGAEHHFEAPASGYQETVRMDFPASMPAGQLWEKYKTARYFVKFADGTHGLIRFSTEGISEWPLYMESWFNPKAGSRALE